ncbi:MAG: chemotaxis protein CheX [Treponema sp.]|nr:chemotaxis protein CheX [Treponema sp.]
MSIFTIEKLSYIFIDALTEVISKMAGFSFDVLSSEADNAFEEITAVMSLNGKNHGMIFISAKEDVMRIICSFMTGIPKEEITINDIEDTLCELVNMTAGNAKLRTNNTEQTYTLSSPFIINGENMSIKAKKGINIISRILGDGQISVKLKVVFYT